MVKRSGRISHPKSASEITKRALRAPATEGDGLFALGEARFGRYGSASRQSSEIKRIAKVRAAAKRTGR
jgi:hypothetical protein